MADDFFKALQMFNNGMTDLATMRAINNANDVVKQLSAQGMKDTERRTAIQGVANQLTAQLSGIGIDPARVQQLGAAFQPPKPNLGSDVEDVMLNRQYYSPEQVSTAERLYGDKLGVEREKKSGKAKETFFKAIESFKDDEKGNYEAIKESMRAASLLDSGDSQMAYELARGALVKSVDPRPSDEDFRRAAPTKELSAKVRRAYAEFVQGEPLSEDKAVVRAVAAAMRSASDRATRRRARGYVSANRDRFGDIDLRDFEQRLIDSTLGKDAPPGAPEAPSPVAPMSGRPIFRPR